MIFRRGEEDWRKHEVNGFRVFAGGRGLMIETMFAFCTKPHSAFKLRGINM